MLYDRPVPEIPSPFDFSEFDVNRAELSWYLLADVEDRLGHFLSHIDSLRYDKSLDEQGYREALIMCNNVFMALLNSKAHEKPETRDLRDEYYKIMIKLIQCNMDPDFPVFLQQFWHTLDEFQETVRLQNPPSVHRH